MDEIPIQKDLEWFPEPEVDLRHRGESLADEFATPAT